MGDATERRGHGPGFVLGAFLGALAGAAAAILLAPPADDGNESSSIERSRSSGDEPETPPAYMTASEDESLARVRAMLERVRARMREAAAAGQAAAGEQERSLNARYAELTRSESPRSQNDAP